jgi:hypothetical protein
MLAIILAGLAAGAIHVLSGPDHLAAVAPLVADTRRSQWRAGFTWGLGHTGGVITVGIAALLFRELLPMDAVSSWSERLVGVALIAVGVWGARRAARLEVHQHVHVHGKGPHAHIHVHAAEPAVAEAPAVRPHPQQPHNHTHASFAFGILHGLAGSAHVLGILPALALPTRLLSGTYLISYGVGNVAAMTLFAAAVGLVSSRANDGGTRFYRQLLYTCSGIAVLVGAFWLAT